MEDCWELEHDLKVARFSTAGRGLVIVSVPETREE